MTACWLLMQVSFPLIHSILLKTIVDGQKKYPSQGTRVQVHSLWRQPLTGAGFCQFFPYLLPKKTSHKLQLQCRARVARHALRGRAINLNGRIFRW